MSHSWIVVSESIGMYIVVNLSHIYYLVKWTWVLHIHMHKSQLKLENIMTLNVLEYGLDCNPYNLDCFCHVIFMKRLYGDHGKRLLSNK